MGRFLLTFLFIHIQLTTIAQSQTVVFRGTTGNGYNNSVIELAHIPSGKKLTTQVRSGKFLFKEVFTGPGLYILTAEKDRSTTGWAPPIPILVEQPGIISISWSGTTGNGVVIKGSAAQQVYENFLQERDWQMPIQLEQEPVAGATTPTEHAPDRLTLSDAADTVTAPLALRTALKHPGSFAAVYILENFTANARLTDLEAVYYQLPARLRQTYHGQRIALRFAPLYSASRNQTVYDFSLPDSAGNSIAFSSIKNNVVLVSFWASWCAPCREEFKLLRHVYEKHKQKGFTIVSISVDGSATAWKQALAKEQLPWLQLRDLDKIPSVARRRFGVTGLPTTFLLDKNRKILYRDLRGGVLDKVVESLVLNNE